MSNDKNTLHRSDSFVRKSHCANNVCNAKKQLMFGLLSGSYDFIKNTDMHRCLYIKKNLHGLNTLLLAITKLVNRYQVSNQLFSLWRRLYFRPCLCITDNANPSDKSRCHGINTTRPFCCTFPSDRKMEQRRLHLLAWLLLALKTATSEAVCCLEWC